MLGKQVEERTWYWLDKVTNVFQLDKEDEAILDNFLIARLEQIELEYLPEIQYEVMTVLPSKISYGVSRQISSLCFLEASFTSNGSGEFNWACGS